MLKVAGDEEDLLSVLLQLKEEIAFLIDKRRDKEVERSTRWTYSNASYHPILLILSCTMAMIYVSRPNKNVKTLKALISALINWTV